MSVVPNILDHMFMSVLALFVHSCRTFLH